MAAGLMALMATACDKLDDGGALEAVVQGTWAFKYTTDQPIDFTLTYERAVFRPDHTCSLEYDGGSLSGTYRAGDALLRIEYDDNGETGQMLWIVRSFSTEQVVAQYSFENNGNMVEATVTLDRISP